MSESFNYIIRSTNKTVATDSHNNCGIRLSCPSLYKYYECEVVGFYLSYLGDLTSDTNTNFYSTGFIELRADNFDFVDFGGDTGNKKTIAFQSTTNFYQAKPDKFKVANFNGVTINFKIVGDDENPLSYLERTTASDVMYQYNKPWVLVLNMKGCNE